MNRANKRQVLGITVAVIAVCLSIGIVKLPRITQTKKRNSIEQEMSQTEQSATAISAYTTQEEPSFLVKNEDTAITSLITRYYQAILNVDKEDYDAITVDEDSMDVEVMLRKMEYIEDYQNLNIYVTQGIEDTGIVAYVTYDLKIHSIDTMAPSIDQFLITYVNGEPKLYFNPLTIKQNHQLAMIRNQEEVLDLIDSIDSDFIAAINSDSKLNDFYTALSQKSTSAEETDSAKKD